MRGAALLLLALAAPASAQRLTLSVSTEGFVSPSTSAYASYAGTVGSVTVRHLNVFDLTVPGEDWWPFRVANRIHIQTREHVIRRELLLLSGDRWDALDALESERNLRASGFIRRAEIVATPRPDRKLDLAVHAQDSWTLAPQLSVGTEGGDRFFIWGIEEGNLLGFGKGVSLFHSQIGPDTRNELRYRDPRLLGTRFRMTDLYARTHRGDEIGVLVDRPFFALHTPWAASLLWARIIQEDTLFRDADDFSKFVQNYRSVQASLAARINEEEDPTQRVLFGTYYAKDRFEPTADTAPGTLPADRNLSGPIVGYSLIQPRFIKETYIDKMDRVEDFNLGNEFSLTGGPMLTSWGSDRDRWMVSALEQQGLGLGDGRFALGQVGVNGRLAGGRAENAIFFTNMNVFWKTVLGGLPQTFVAHAEFNTTKNLDGESQLVLGGNTGLRGYKNNSFTGARSFLVNFEDRFFWTRELFHLFYLGGVAFYETGAVAGERAEIPNARTLKSDVGFGFRVASSRSTSGSVIRMDLAYALDRGPGASRWVFSVRGGQAFQIFNSTNRNAIRNPAANIGEESAGARLRRR